jgi:hypothetical protein
MMEDLLKRTLGNNRTIAKWAAGCSSPPSPSEKQLSDKTLQKFVSQCIEDLAVIVDCHVHAVSGEYVHPHTANRVLEYALFGCRGHQGREQAHERLGKWIGAFQRLTGGREYKAWIFAFTSTYDRETGKENLDKTGFKVTNEFVESLAYFGQPVHSIHPYEAPQSMKAKFDRFRPRLLKLLPNSMGFSVKDIEGCREFFELVDLYRSALIVHVGDEHSVPEGKDTPSDDNGDPESFRFWLRLYPNLRVVFAHVGSCGTGNCEKVLGLMNEFPQQTWADISCLCMPRRAKHLVAVLNQPDSVIKRLLYGTDYPLVNIRVLLQWSVAELVLRGLLTPSVAVFVLKLFRVNPLLASLCLYRSVKTRDTGRRFPPEVFNGVNAAALLRNY